MNTNITMARKQTLKGPGGIKIELDADEIFPNDPGQGTPILVNLYEGTASYNCAVSENEVDGIELEQIQIEWLNKLEYQIDTWLTNHSRAAK